jgi:hypothetical protein
MIKWSSAALAISIVLNTGCDKNEWNLPKTKSTQQQEASSASENTE